MGLDRCDAILADNPDSGYNLFVKRVILGVLASALVASAGFLVWTLWSKSQQRNGSLAAADRSYVGSIWDPARDPRLGEKIPAVSIHDQAGRRTLVLALGSCASCSAKSLEFDWLLNTNVKRILALFEGPVSNPPPELPNHIRERLYLAPSDYAKYQALWPRMYAVDAQGRLLAAQRPDESGESFVRRWFP